MSTIYDVIVVGGGPAGMGTALTVAKSGKSVILVDRKKHEEIGNKNCGDALDMSSPQILHDNLHISMPHDNEIAENLELLSVSTQKQSIAFAAPGYTMNRHTYGQRLLKECQELGVIVVDNAPVREVIIEENMVVGVRYKKDGKLVEIYAKVVADCSGTLGAIRSKLPEGFSLGIRGKIEDHHIAAAYREIVRMKQPHKFPKRIDLTYEPEIPPPGYIWFFTKGENLLNIGTGWLKSEPQADKSMREIFREAFRKYYADDDYEILHSGGGQIPMRPTFDCLTFNGGVLVGDAGCMADPTTAEGHGPALVSGFYAGSAIINALDNSNVSREGLWEYNRKVQAHYGRRNAISYATLQFLRELGGDGLDFVLKRKLITEDEMAAIFEGEELNIGFTSLIIKILRAMPRVDILLKMKKLINQVSKLGAIYDNYPAEPKNLNSWINSRNEVLGEVL
ncbi:MAG: NAD(P)/FAD-dependent oxidoreductase [Candidatus Heimdallarchaeota archaeon]|nr:NAD(P)/FAD-dependent oxidoreductase [Candidatus Heimdallarchaeota archaeon]